VFVFRPSNADAITDMEDALRLVFPPKGPTRFGINQERNTIFVYGTPPSLAMAREIISRRTGRRRHASA